MKIIRADCRDRDRLGRAEILGALDTQYHGGIVGRAQRIALRQRRLFDAWQAADPLERRLKKSRVLLGIKGRRQGPLHSREQQAIRIETKIDFGEAQKTPDHEASANQQNQR